MGQVQRSYTPESNKDDRMNKPRILIWDVETSLMQVTTFGLFQDVRSHEAIVTDWHIICACWKWDDEEYIDSVRKSGKDNDRYVCVKLRRILEKADILVHHNGDRFDLKKLNARLIYHGLDPLPPIPTVDTLKQARKIARFTSNRLDYLGKYLGFGGKVSTPPNLWPAATNGCRKSIDEMVEYCKRDVELLGLVYNKLKPYMTGHPNVNLITDGTHSCPKCGSSRLQKRGFIFTRVSKKQRYQCLDCRSWCSDSVNLGNKGVVR